MPNLLLVCCMHGCCKHAGRRRRKKRGRGTTYPAALHLHVCTLHADCDAILIFCLLPIAFQVLSSDLPLTHAQAQCSNLAPVPHYCRLACSFHPSFCLHKTAFRIWLLSPIDTPAYAFLLLAAGYIDPLGACL